MLLGRGKFFEVLSKKKEKAPALEISHISR